MTVDSSFFCSMHDVADVGPEQLCDNLLALGLTGVTVAATYHAARDLRPRGSLQRLVDLPAGAHYFPASPDYPHGLEPSTPAPFGDSDLLAALRAATAERGMRLAAWTVFGFQERLGRAQPGLCQRTIFGDPSTSDLCPANPLVRTWALTLAADVARHRPDTLVAESLHYAPLRLTRRFLPLDAEARLALGLCFCVHCVDAARSAGVDVDAVRVWAAVTVESAFAGERREDATPKPLDELPEAVRAFLTARAGVVSALVKETVELLAPSGVALRMLDQAAVEPPALGPSIVDEAFRSGVDVAETARRSGGYQVLGYGEDIDDVARIMNDYRHAIGADAGMRVVLRPSWPDCIETHNLEAKIAAALESGAEGIDFYHYGFASHDALDRVRVALRGLR
ncbi:MAG: hypothetical protein JWO18_114 [Microbacteriaceae bacterium]|nr:hypothetical protein [Microbacteriaceae bacterium]